MLPAAVVLCAARCVLGRGGGLCVNSDVLGVLVGCSLSSNHISDAGAAKIAAALPNSKLTVLE